MSLNVKDICFSYGERPILKSIRFSAEYGEFLSVLGPNGVGKSTLFRCMLGLLVPSSGMTEIDGIDILTMGASDLAKKIAYIPQSHSPVFNFTVEDMVLMGTTAQTGRCSSPGKKEKRISEEAMEKLEITHLKDRGYGNISGGERQLVLIARAIAQQAKILVMDEPSANLDFGNKIRVMRTVKKLTEDGYTVIQSTHDPDQAFLYSDKILALHDGQILSFGTPQDIMTSELISRLYNVDVDVCSLKKDEIRVCIPDLKLRKEKHYEKENSLFIPNCIHDF